MAAAGFIYEAVRATRLDKEVSELKETLSSRESELSTLTRKKGLGFSRQEVVNAIGATFEPFNNDPETYNAKINGVYVSLWGPAEDLQAIKVTGSFEGEYGIRTADVVRTIVQSVIPDWSPSERAAWFVKAATADNDLDISTKKGKIRVSVVKFVLEGHRIAHIALAPYGD